MMVVYEASSEKTLELSQNQIGQGEESVSGWGVRVCVCVCATQDRKLWEMKQ